MKTYQVTWGDVSKVVEAENDSDAWAKFADGCDLAQRHPDLHRRLISEVVAKPVAKPVEAKPAAKVGPPPVATRK